MGLLSSKEQPTRLCPFFFTNALRFKRCKLDEGNIQNDSDTKLSVPMDHSEAIQNKPKSSLERISKWWKYLMERFGWV